MALFSNRNLVSLMCGRSDRIWLHQRPRIATALYLRKHLRVESLSGGQTCHAD